MEQASRGFDLPREGLVSLRQESNGVSKVTGWQRRCGQVVNRAEESVQERQGSGKRRRAREKRIRRRRGRAAFMKMGAWEEGDLWAVGPAGPR